jgi:HK97 family phage portal protein
MPHLDFARAFAADLGGEKAIQPHPALMSDDPVSVYQPGASRQDARIRDHRAKLHGQVYGGSLAMDTTMNCVDFYATNISAAPWRLEALDGTRLVERKNDGMPDDFREGPADLYQLLKRPNPFMLYDELIELLIIDLLLVGNAYWYKFGNDPSKPLWLFRCAPSGMDIIPGQIGPKRYEYRPPGVRNPIKMEPEQVLHFKLPNPHDGFYGMGIVQKGSRAMDLDINVTDTMTSYYGNRADPSVIVQSERRVPRDVFQKLKAQLRQRMTGPANAGQLLVLEAGLKASTLSPSAADALFDAVSGLSEGKVYRMFKLSKLLFGEFANASAAQIIPAARREADNYVLKPFANKLATRVTEHLATAWDAKFIIDYNYALSPEEQLKALEVTATLPGIKVRELRRGMLGLGIVDSESTGDPEIDEEVLNMPMEEMDENGEGGAADRPIGSEPGRPPKGKNTTSFKRTRTPGKKALPSAPRSLDQIMADMAAIEAKVGQKAVVQQDGGKISIGYKLDDEKRPGDPSRAARDRAVDDVSGQLQRDLAQAATRLERALLDTAEGKAFKPGDLRNRLAKSKAWDTFREDVAAAMEKAAQLAASSAAMDSGIETEFDYDEIAKRVVYRPAGVRGIVRNLKSRLLAKLANELGPESTKIEADRVIMDYIADWRTGQAETVAITEAVEAYNETMLDALEDAGDTEVYVEDGEEHDDACRDAHGSVWPIEHARANLKEHPRCRRAFLRVPEVA